MDKEEEVAWKKRDKQIRTGRPWLKNVKRWEGQNESENIFIYVSVCGWRCFQKEIKDGTKGDGKKRGASMRARGCLREKECEKNLKDARNWWQQHKKSNFLSRLSF